MGQVLVGGDGCGKIVDGGIGEPCFYFAGLAGLVCVVDADGVVICGLEVSLDVGVFVAADAGVDEQFSAEGIGGD